MSAKSLWVWGLPVSLYSTEEFNLFNQTEAEDSVAGVEESKGKIDQDSNWQLIYNEMNNDHLCKERLRARFHLKLSINRNIDYFSQATSFRTFEGLGLIFIIMMGTFVS